MSLRCTVCPSTDGVECYAYEGGKHANFRCQMPLCKKHMEQLDADAVRFEDKHRDKLEAELHESLIARAEMARDAQEGR
jgi:hypothetical protein